jgi:hypothetical protein
MRDTLTGSLFGPLAQTREPEVRRATLPERFEDFHEANPHVYDALRGLAMELVAHGRRRGAIAQLFEVLRWQYAISTVGDDDFMLNNDYRAFYARLLMSREPALWEFFELRRSVAGGVK